jgi:hypothetical protein
MKPDSKEPLWRCPECGHRFVTRNLWHSCGRYRLADHFKGKPPELKRAFDAFVKVARSFGPATVYAQKTRIIIQGRTRFAGAEVRNKWVDARMWLKRRVDHPLLTRVESYGRLGYGIHFRLTKPEDVDTAMKELMGEAYAIGQQEAPRPR